jgi:hypothetical protein
VAYLARRAKDYDVHTGEISIDMAVVRERKRNIVKTRPGEIRSGTKHVTLPAEILCGRHQVERKNSDKKSTPDGCQFHFMPTPISTYGVHRFQLMSPRISL